VAQPGLARLLGVQEVASSNLAAPTLTKPCRVLDSRYLPLAGSATRRSERQAGERPRSERTDPLPRQRQPAGPPSYRRHTTGRVFVQHRGEGITSGSVIPPIQGTL
jgi:hypothetical protein